MTVRRPDFTEVKPTEDEVADWKKRYPTRGVQTRAVHNVCGTRIWYAGLSIGSHVRNCPGRGSTTPKGPTS